MGILPCYILMMKNWSCHRYEVGFLPRERERELAGRSLSARWPLNHHLKPSASTYTKPCRLQAGRNYFRFLLAGIEVLMWSESWSPVWGIHGIPGTPCIVYYGGGCPSFTSSDIHSVNQRERETHPDHRERERDLITADKHDYWMRVPADCQPASYWMTYTARVGLGLSQGRGLMVSTACERRFGRLFVISSVCVEVVYECV